jgi:hypothetical protein
MSQVGIAKSAITSKSGGSGGSSAFSAITTGTNSTATMTVGTGASLLHSGNGQVDATLLQGISVSGSNPSNGNDMIYDGTNFVWSHQPGIFQAVAPTLAAMNLTAQAANVATNTVLAVPASGLITGGLYRLDVRLVITRAASSGSTLPDSQVIFTDSDSGGTITAPVTAGGATTNTTSTVAQGSYVFYAKASTNIQIAVGQVTPYASTGATTMQLSYRARLTYLS